MDLVTVFQNTIAFLKKYRYVLIVLIVGMGLMSLPDTEKQKSVPPESKTVCQIPDLSEQLEAILCQIQGAGEVSVLLTVAAGPETVYQQKEDVPVSTDSGSIRREPVVITDGQRVQTGLVRMELGPEYLGAVILCQGADSAVVRLAIVEAVSNATGLSTNCISVLKMK